MYYHPAAFKTSRYDDNCAAIAPNVETIAASTSERLDSIAMTKWQRERARSLLARIGLIGNSVVSAGKFLARLVQRDQVSKRLSRHRRDVPFQ